MSGRMMAVKMYAPGDLRVEETGIPGLKTNEVLIKVMAVGVCGSDIPRINHYGAHISPIIPGHEFSGLIVEKGDAVNGLNIGDKVTVPPLLPCHACPYCQAGHYSLCENYSYFGSRCDGAFAQYVAVPRDNIVKMAENVTFEAAATVDPLANALHAVKKGRFKENDKVCVVGAGPIGLYAIQYMSKMNAAKVIAVDIEDSKIDVAKQSGAHSCLDSSKGDPVQSILEYTDGGADLIIDTSGAPAAQQQAILSTAKLGRIVLLGISHKSLILSEEAVDRIMRCELDIIGSWNSFSSPFPGWEWTCGAELLERDIIDADKIISHRLPLENVPETFKRISRKEFVYNKIMFFPWGIR